MREIREDLWLGSYIDAKNPKRLERLGIRHCVDVSGTLSTPTLCSSSPIRTLHVKLEAPVTDTKQLRAVLAWMSAHHKVMVHGTMSSVVVAATLMYREGLGLEEAVLELPEKEQRDQVMMNSGSIQVLKILEEEIWDRKLVAGILNVVCPCLLLQPFCFE